MYQYLNLKGPTIERRVLREDIKKFLLNCIITGILQPGQRIIETRIAKELGVSQAPVREAIRELEQMGLVETIPYQGTYVKKLTRKSLKEAYEVRGILEAAAAREAARRISSQEIKEMEHLIDDMVTAAENNDHSLYVEKDIAFHEAIFKAAGNELLYKLWSTVHMGNFTVVTTNISKRSLRELAERHKPLLDSIANRDPEQAESLAKLHISELAEEVLNTLSE